MRFARFWQSRTNASGLIKAWGWSDQSEAEAGRNAESRLARILNFLRDGKDAMDRYGYGSDGVLREPVVEEGSLSDGSRYAVSRNAYGAFVLNAERVVFIDVDVSLRISLVDRLKGLFGRGIDPAAVFAAREQAIRDWQRENSRYSIACYRTYAGFRLVIRNFLASPENDEVRRILRELCNDANYRQLCARQACFRARLTPKPYRTRTSMPPARFPFEKRGDAEKFAAWSEAYLNAATGYAVCREPVIMGEAEPLPAVRELLAVHDKACCRGEHLPLA